MLEDNLSMSGSHFFVLPNSYARDEKNHLNRQFAGDCGDQTPASSGTIKCAIQYSRAGFDVGDTLARFAS